MTTWFKTTILAGVAGWICATSTFAQTPTLPDDTAYAAFSDAVEIYRGGNTQGAFGALPDNDQLLSDLLRWVELRDTDDDISFGAYQDLLSRRSDWPGLDRIRAAAEREIDDSLTTSRILGFFEGGDVQTGEGAVAYANALIADGRTEEAEAMLVDVWRNDALTASSHQAVVDAFPDVVAPHHVARVDMLLWRWRTSDASRVLPLLDDDQRALARARIAIITRAGDVTEREDLVPDRLQDNAGLHYDRFNWYADRGDWTEATAILNDRSATAETLGTAWRWGSWRRILARWQMREGNITTAYRLAAQHFIEADETNYSDLEWLARVNHEPRPCWRRDLCALAIQPRVGQRPCARWPCLAGRGRTRLSRVVLSRCSQGDGSPTDRPARSIVHGYR